MRSLLTAAVVSLAALPTARAQSSGRVYIVPLNAAGGPGAGDALILAEPLGGRFTTPTRLASSDGALASFTVRSAPRADVTDGRFEVALQISDSTGALGGGLALGVRSYLPPGAASDDETVNEHSFELGLGASNGGRLTLGGTFIGASSSLDSDDEKKDRGTSISYALAGAYEVDRYLRLSAATAPRAIRTQLTAGAREVAIGAEVPAILVALPVRGLRALRAGAGAEYGRLVSGPTAGDGATRLGGWLDGVGPIRLRATAARAAGGGGWTMDSGATLAIRHLRVGAASSRLAGGGQRVATVSIGINSASPGWR